MSLSKYLDRTVGVSVIARRPFAKGWPKMVVLWRDKSIFLINLAAYLTGFHTEYIGLLSQQVGQNCLVTSSLRSLD